MRIRGRPQKYTANRIRRQGGVERGRCPKPPRLPSGNLTLGCNRLPAHGHGWSPNILGYNRGHQLKAPIALPSLLSTSRMFDRYPADKNCYSGTRYLAYSGARNDVGPAQVQRPGVTAVVLMVFAMALPAMVVGDRVDGKACGVWSAGFRQARHVPVWPGDFRSWPSFRPGTPR